MRGFCCIGLDNPKSVVNVGAVLRAAGCFNASMVAISGARCQKGLNHACTDTMCAYRRIPVLRVSDLKDVIPLDCVPVAVELVDGATNLLKYQHPQRAFYIFGAEDATLGDRVFSWCRDVVQIPTTGCLNLAATVNIVLYDRLLKRRRSDG